MLHVLSQVLGPPHLFGIRVEFFLFALTLAGVAIFHRYTMYVALTGLFVILIFKYLTVPDFSIFHHIAGFQEEEGEWRTLLNLAGLLLGFAVLSRHFELSGVPDKLPHYLPNDWKGGLLLLLIIMILSTFLDNIASFAAFAVFGIIASIQQQKYQPIQK